ncbi:MAG: late competence development ComFB family protein [Candidatus Riflebacteria bacterium]|nr:late competence development ComFB family protein [Candidatus Riflebacteria bacterium]
MEAFVEMAMDEILSKRSDVCGCERCRLDQTALSLNALPPRYVVSDFGEVVTNLDLDSSQHKADCMVAVLQAIEIVRKNPRH